MIEHEWDAMIVGGYDEYAGSKRDQSRLERGLKMLF